MHKWVITAGVGFVCLVFALIPETVAYYLYHFINPTSEWGRIATGGILLWAGLGLSLVFAFIAAVVFFAFVKAALETK